MLGRSARAGIGMVGLAAAFGRVEAQGARAEERTSGATRTRELALEPYESPLRPYVRSQLLPVHAQDLVLVASATRLFALDAGTLEPRWCADPPAGWWDLDEPRRFELEQGIDHELAWTAPAVGGDVVVAALQLPLSLRRSDSWGGLLMAVAIPEWRLFAFDRATGSPLWDHGPRSGDLRRGETAQRQNVIGPPLVVETRVLVPCASDANSIDYRISAYDLSSGSPLWSTFVQRGQIERNQLQQQVNEFRASPLVPAPDGRVLAATGLGRLASLDSTTGDLCWIAAYPATLLPRLHQHPPLRRTLRWRSMPPVVAGDVVVVAPADARALLAFDLHDGRLLWSLSDREDAERFGRRPAYDHLVGVEGDTVYLGGPEVAALRCVGGLRAPSTFEIVWTLPARSLFGTRVRLANGTLFVPEGAASLREIDARSGEERRTLAVDATLGLLVDDEALFAAGAGVLARVQR